jgi:serine/threonine protein kinase
MTPERYRQINALAEAALNMSGQKRAEFLERACGSDEDLLTRVNELVRSHQTSSGFLETHALDDWARDVAASSSKRSLAGCEVGRYLVLSHLGSGGIGDVWLAQDRELSREVALKLLSEELAGGSDHAQRFRQEARAASSLNHANLVTIFDIGQFEGQQFIAQEYVPGKTIRDALRTGAMDVETVLKIASQVAAALNAAHGAGIVHRDIKPENIMIRPDGLVKVLDFGLARFLEADPANDPEKPDLVLTRPGFIIGTARYMSPEQARGLPVDGRSDIFSLGVVLYEMLAGTPPFAGSTPSDVLASILTATPEPLSRYSKNVPTQFERIVQRCLAKDPAARYPDAAALQNDLSRAAAQMVEKRNSPAKRRTVVLAACAVLAVLTFAYFTSTYFLESRKEPAVAFNSMRISRPVTRGEAVDAAISHHGKLLAYVLNEPSGQSVWVRNSNPSNESAVVPAEPGEHSGVVFSPDDSFLYYRRRGSEDLGDLYRVPVKGGTPERVIGEASGYPALSPDGRQLAFVRLRASSWEASLIVSNADGSGEFTLATLRRPRYFDEHGVAWSPDGRSIAYFAGEGEQYSRSAFHLMEVRLSDRSQHVVTGQSWSWPRSVAWSAKGDILLVTAASRGDDVFQIWMVRHRGGLVTRLTNDLTNYNRVTLTDDGKSLATIQSERSSAIWVGSVDAARTVRVTTTPLRSARHALAWTPERRILYSDLSDDYRDLWLMDSDGRNRQLLASKPGNKDEFVITRDGRYIVYKQERNIWRMDADGTHAQQLTRGANDVHPEVAADGRSVFYASFAEWSPGIGGQPTLWSVPIGGGAPVKISSQPISYPKLSPDGARLGCIYYPGKDPRFSADHLAVLGLNGTGGFRIFDASPSDETPISWSPDGTALDYVVNSGGVGNIWRQPLDGRTAVQLTHFTSDELYSFAEASDGRLACVRGTTTRGLVLIEDFH